MFLIFISKETPFHEERLFSIAVDDPDEGQKLWIMAGSTNEIETNTMKHNNDG